MPTLWMMSGSDEYVPPSTDKQAARRKYAAVLRHPKSRCMVMDGAVHNLTGHEELAADIMIDFLECL